MYKIKLASAILATTCGHVAFAQSGMAELSYRYQNARTEQMEMRNVSTALDTSEYLLSHPAIEKTLLVIDMGTTLASSLEGFENTCAQEVMPDLGEQPNLPNPSPFTECANARAQELLDAVFDLSIRAEGLNLAQDDKIFETLDLFRTLSLNIKNYRGYFSDFEYAIPISPGISMPVPSSSGPNFGVPSGVPIPSGPSLGVPQAAPIAGPSSSLGVTTGGAQDFSYLRKLIKDGYIPQSSDFYLKGFMSEFALNPLLENCNQLICVEPLYKLDQEKQKLYVQIAMGTNVVESEFQRNPLNLGLVIDISGSMAAYDDTDKSRLEWAKDAAIAAINKLNENDYVSVVIFDSYSKVLVPTIKVASEDIKREIIEKIQGLETQGSTNLYDGLRSSYELMSDAEAFYPQADSRIILISDAGLNTGITDDTTTLAMVSNYAAEGIGLTAIGLGENFNQEFILGITRALGGNYLFAQSGDDMIRFFESFNFLVTPVAHQFKARLSLAHMNASFVKAYGFPDADETFANELINVQSLFFTKSGGGAIVLEYDLHSDAGM